MPQVDKIKFLKRIFIRIIVPRKKEKGQYSEMSAGFCCQVPANPARRSSASGLKVSITQAAYAAIAIGARLSFAIVLCEPIRWFLAETKLTPLDVRLSYFDPIFGNLPTFWWSRRVPPPGPIRLLRARLCPQLYEQITCTTAANILQYLNKTAGKNVRGSQ